MKILYLLSITILSAVLLNAQMATPPDYLRMEYSTWDNINSEWDLYKFSNVELLDSLPVNVVEYSVNMPVDSQQVARWSYSYNSLKKLTQYINSSYNTESHEWDIITEESYTYSENNYLFEEISHTGTNYYKQVYYRDETSGLVNLSYKLSSKDQGGNWDTLNKFEQIFDVKNRVDKTIIYNYDSGLNSYYPRYETDYTYSNADSLVESIEYKIDGDVKTNFYKSDFEYNENNLLSKESYSTWQDDEWHVYNMIEHEYYSDMKPMLETTTTYSDFAVDPQIDIKYFLFENNKKIVYDTTKSGDETSIKRMIYYYPIKTSVDKLSDNIHALIAYPNPAKTSETITIKSNNFVEGNARVTVQSVDGHYVAMKDANVYDGNVKFICPNLASGTYFVSVWSGQNILGTCKLLITK